MKCPKEIIATAFLYLARMEGVLSLKSQSGEIQESRPDLTDGNPELIIQKIISLYLIIIRYYKNLTKQRKNLLLHNITKK